MFKISTIDDTDDAKKVIEMKVNKYITYVLSGKS